VIAAALKWSLTAVVCSAATGVAAQAGATDSADMSIPVLPRVEATTTVDLTAQSAAPAAMPRHVAFDSRATDAAGRPVPIAGAWFLPPGGGPFPAVIALHGCGGLWATAMGRRDALAARHQAMADLLAAEGYAVLFPDSLRPRGIAELCTQRIVDRSLKVAQRRADALGALDWVQRQPQVRGDRVALLGWSHGGSTTLATVVARRTGTSNPVAPQPFFRMAIAFYPGCSAYARAGTSGRWLVPLAIFIGEADDWTPAAPCVALGDAMREAGQPVTVTVYPGAFHDFDHPEGRIRVRVDVPNGVLPDKGVTTAPDPAARADRYAKVRSLLAGALRDDVAPPTPDGPPMPDGPRRH
jgi:dienelactone hydrolase